MDLRDQMHAALGSSYTIERELEAGGMSRVFVATEESLRRSVVIKVLPPETAGWVSLERFKREILVSARLQHPHIVPLLSAGDADGVPFYTMPFVRGESLRARMQRSPVPLAEVEAIVRDVARGLEYAHAHGVVHRDIKPENILLAGSTATVLDFGIAKALVASRTSSGSETLTQLGTALGTPAYMSPEQIAGDAVDGRGDIYSLGVIAYELLAGSHPFAGKTNQQLLAAHVVEAPPPLIARRPDTPPALAALVMRCLEKDFADRPVSATELLRLLEEATRPSASAPSESPSIAVLPFTNLGGVDDEFFSDGLTDEIIADLSRIRALRVIARGSMMRQKGTTKDLPELARELNVVYVLEGNVRRAAEHLRITARLVDARNGETVWSDKLAGTIEDVFEIQEKLARTIVQALPLAVSSDESRRLGSRDISNVRAYESYLKARHELWSFNAPSLGRAKQLVENALAIVGDNALLYATLGQVHLNYLESGVSTDPSHMIEAERAARKVFALEPDSAAGHRLRGWIDFHRGEMSSAIDSLERARTRDPSNADVLMMLSYAYLLNGHDALGEETGMLGLAIDPLTPLMQCMPGIVRVLRGQFEESLPYYRTFYTMEPQNPAAVWFLALMYGYAGRRDEVGPLVDSLERDFAGTVFASQGRAYERALAGDADGAQRAITPALRAAASNAEYLARSLADTYALIGHSAEAIEYLEHAVRLGLAHYPFLARHDPHLAGIRNDPGFRRVLDRIRGAGKPGVQTSGDRSWRPRTR